MPHCHPSRRAWTAARRAERGVRSFDVHTALAANYRVPQLRKRIFVVGLRRELRGTFKPGGENGN